VTTYGVGVSVGTTCVSVGVSVGFVGLGV
jgi:hypothetical protein